MFGRGWGPAGKKLRPRRGGQPLGFWFFFNVWVTIPDPPRLGVFIRTGQNLSGALNGEFKLVKDARNMGRMVSDREFLFNDSGDHGTSPNTRMKSVGHRATIQDDLSALTATFHKVNKVVMALALPMGVGLLLTGPELADILFGIKWQGLGFVLSVIGLTNGIVWIVGINTELYRAMGRPDINAKVLLIAAAYYLPTYFMAAPFGLNVFTYARFIVGLLGIPIHVYICKSMLKFSPLYLWNAGKRIIIATFFMGIAIVLLKNGVSIFMPHLQTFMILPILIIAGMVVYAGSLWLLDRSFIMQTKGQIIRAAQS